MNKKGQTMGKFLLGFIGIIVAIALFIAAAQQVGDATNRVSTGQLLFTAPVNGTATYFNDYKSFGGTITVTNRSDGVTIQAGNYTITNNFINPTTGELSVRLVPAADCPAYCERDWNISSTSAEPLGYIPESSGRAVAGLIIIFAALAIALIGILLSNEGMREIIKEKMGR